jgi:hypothetical protein
MCAQALLAIAAARPGLARHAASRRQRHRAARGLARHRQAARHRRRPATRRRPGLVKVSVPGARLLRLATTPMSCAARDLGYAWSRWRRRHQARARWHPYHAQLLTATRRQPTPQPHFVIWSPAASFA